MFDEGRKRGRTDAVHLNASKHYGHWSIFSLQSCAHDPIVDITKSDINGKNFLQ